MKHGIFVNDVTKQPQIMKPKITPFPSQADGFRWKSHNCEHCIKSHEPEETVKYGSLQQLRQVAMGNECELKYAVDRGIWSGEMDKETSMEIGRNEQGGLRVSCLGFMPKIEIHEPVRKKKFTTRFLERIGIV